MARAGDATAAFALTYLTFFLDNVLLTVLVPIIPDWVRGAPATAAAGNATAGGEGGEGWSQAAVGAVLGAKAAAQLGTAPLAAAAVARRGPARVLRLATALLAAAALVLAAAALGGLRRGAAAWLAGAARALHGAGAALAGVAGLALCAAAVPAPPARRDRALGALLGAVALGVLVGYPFGGAAYALWSPGAPFLLLAGALLADLGLQYMLLDREEFNQPARGGGGGGGGRWAGAVWAAARREAAGWCAGAVLLTTCVMAALEPCLPPWLEHRFHPQRWQTGAVFVPDSLGYLAAASGLGGCARRLGAERVALAGQACVGAAALLLPLARSLRALAGPHALLGAGLGACDAALVPALLARWPRRVPALAALLQAAGSAAYAAAPLLAGALASLAGFPAVLRTLGVLNLLYAALLYRALARHPLSEQWGAAPPSDSEDEDEDDEEDAALGAYAALR